MTFLSVAAAILPALAVVLAVVLAQTPMHVSVSFDCTYDNPEGSMATVACSDGQNGLANRFPLFSNVPSFANIGGAPAITGFNSPECGSCWNLTYAPTGITIGITAIDVSTTGFNIALEAMNALTNQLAVDLGRVNATAVPVAAAFCAAGGALARTHPPKANACPTSFDFKSPPLP